LGYSPPDEKEKLRIEKMQGAMEGTDVVYV
jgi:hypothetical protein